MNISRGSDKSDGGDRRMEAIESKQEWRAEGRSIARLTIGRLTGNKDSTVNVRGTLVEGR